MATLSAPLCPECAEPMQLYRLTERARPQWRCPFCHQGKQRQRLAARLQFERANARWLADTCSTLSGRRFGGVACAWCGAILFALGGSLGLASGLVMAVRGRGTPLPADCARELVVAGPYRYIRNPMAVAGLTQGVAVGVFLGSPAVIAFALLGGPVWHLFVRPWEEADLERRFGEPYRRYRAAVRCWLPRLPGYRHAGESRAESAAAPYRRGM